MFIATKVHYFGVGGSLTSFFEHVKRDDRFDVAVAWKSFDISNGKRVIVKLRFRFLEKDRFTNCKAS